MVKIDWPYVRLSLLCFLGVVVLAAYPLARLASPDEIQGVIAGGIMSVCNFFLGYAAIEIGFDKSNTTFLKVVLGGMVIRLILMWSVFLILIAVYNVDRTSLVISLMSLYIVNLVLEIYFLEKKVSVKNQP